MANEKRLIDANELTDRLNHTAMVAYPNLFPGLLAAVEVVDDLPTADAVEVVHGRWEWLGPNRLVPECMCGTCSACKVRSKYIVKHSYCPNCGAKMDGEING